MDEKKQQEQIQRLIPEVQAVLGKFVKKPQLTDKHLTRPPFRFLHDIFIAVLNGTGFYQGLFTSSEIDSAGINTKEEKAQFLQKVINVTALATGEEVNAKVNKILAGLEADQTLEFLKILGTALENGVSSTEAVDIVLGGNKKKNVGTKPVTAVKEDKSKKSPYGQIKPPPPTANQKQAKNEEKPKASTKTKAKSPASKGSNSKPTSRGNEEPEVVDETLPQKSEKEKPRERSRSRSISKGTANPPAKEHRRGSTDKGKPKTETKSKDSKLQQDSNKSQNSSGRGSTRAERSSTSIPQSQDSEVVKNEDDSIQFMGEVESILQEHGIEIEEENPKVQVVERKKSSTRIKSSKTTEKTVLDSSASAQEKDDIVEEEIDNDDTSSNDNILIDDSSSPKPNPNIGSETIGTGKGRSLPPKSSSVRRQNDSNGIDSENETGKPVPIPGRPSSNFVRPSSARPAPPRPKTAIVEEEGPFRPPTSKIPVILDSEEVEDEEIDMRKQGLLDLLSTSTSTMGAADGDMGGDTVQEIGGFKGHLVEQIMETKRDLESGDKEDKDMSSRRKQTQAELEKLKSLIQTTARLANPLGRLMDFLQEDMDAMTAEYVKYKTEGKRLKDLLDKEKEITRERLKPKRKELMELMDKLEQQNYEIRAAHNDLNGVEEHLNNYMASIEAGPEQVDIPTKFLIKGEWEFDMEVISEDLDNLERRVKPRSGPFGDYPPFLCVSAEAKELEQKGGGESFNIPKPKRKMQNQSTPPGFLRKEFKKSNATPPTFNIEEDDDGTIGGFFKNVRNQSRRNSNQYLEPPPPELDSLEVLNDN